MGEMLSLSAVFPWLDQPAYAPHALHSQERVWPQTNCYVDLWIEVLASFGTRPEAMLGFTLTQDFEGDQFTFFKVPLEDIEALYGIRVTELAIFDKVEDHIAVQIARGRLCIVEMDSFYLPDTQGVSYRTEHGKTTVAINRMNPAARTLEYFHNDGYFRLEGEDFDGLFQHHLTESDPPFLPYSEFAKFPGRLPSEDALRTVADTLLRKHFAHRPEENPITAFAAVFPRQVEAIAERPFAFFHKYAFNTLRQVGANFELLASHLDWLAPTGALKSEADAARAIAENAKSVQFQLARAVTRRKFDPLVTALDPAIESWDRLMQGLERKLA